jgi:excisionase family DNA binding protein
MAEMHGFSAEIEKSVLDGSGSIDVSLENEDLKIACEVSVTTTDYETHNIQKCLAAGYDYAAVVVSNKKKIPLISAKLDSEIPNNLIHKLKVFSLMDLLAFLRGFSDSNETPKKKKTRGPRMSFTDACELLDKSASTLYRWVREGRIPFYRVGRDYEFDRDELLLIGRQDLSAKWKATVKLSPLTIERSAPKTKKEQDARYRKLLKLDKMEEPLHTRREKEANDS